MPRFDATPITLKVDLWKLLEVFYLIDSLDRARSFRAFFEYK